MQNFLKFTIILFSGILFFSCASSGIQVTKIGDLPKEVDLKNLPTQEQYPDSDGVILYENIIYDVDYVPSVGIETYKTFHKVYRVFRDEEYFMENHIYLNDKTVFESFSARTIKPDGSTHDLTERDIYYYTVNKKNQDYEGKNQSATYNIPQVKKGDLVEIKYTVINSYFYFSGKYWVQSSLPKKYSRFEIRLPNFIFDPPWPYKFKYIVKNIIMPDPVFKKGFGDSGDQVYIWERKDIPKLKEEVGMGRKSLYQGHIKLRLSSWNTWRSFGRKHYKRFYHSVLEEMSDEEEEIISNKKNELLTEKMSDLEKIKALYNYTQEFYYDATHVYFGHGYKPNNIKTIFDRGYGDCKDHTVILTALLRDAGFEAWPTAIRAGNNDGVDPKFVTDIFNHIIVKVYLKGGQVIWLDPTATYTPFGKLPAQCEDTYSLEIRPKDKDDRKKVRLEKTPLSNHSDNVLDQKIGVEIKKDKAIFNVQMSMTGFFAASSRSDFNYNNERLLKRAFRKSVIKFLYDSKINDFKIKNIKDLEKPVLISFTLEKDISDHESIPVIINGIGILPSDINSMYYKNRIRPIKLGNNFSFKKKINISYDKNDFSTDLKTSALNKKFNFNNGFQWELTGTTEPGSISFSSEYAQKTKEVVAKDVPEYLKTISSVHEHIKKVIYASHLKRKTAETKTEPVVENKVSETEEVVDKTIEKSDAPTKNESLEKE